MSEIIPRRTHDVFLKVDGIHCSACVDKISRALGESHLCESYWIDRASNVVRLRRGHGGLSDGEFALAVQGALAKIGYPTEIIKNPSTAGKNEWVGQLSVATLGMLVSIFILPSMSVPFSRNDLLVLLGVVALFFLSYRSFAKGAWQSLKSRTFGVDALVALGAGAAFLLSMSLIVAQIPGHLMWVEAFAILLLVSLGHFIENFILLKADKTLRSLMLLAPPTARRVLGKGKVEEVSVEELKIGDILQLAPGDRVPVDGKIIEGRSDFDESLLTGEPMAAAKGNGEEIFAGTVNLSGNLKFEVKKLGKDMLLTQIIETVMRVRHARADIQKMADRVSNVFVPVVVGIALLAFLLWWLAPQFMETISTPVGSLFFLHFSHNPQPFWAAFSAALGVLVISCPCAMGLATPSALIAVSGLAAKQGILIRDGRAIEIAEKIKHVFFDKTGTLSSAAPTKVNEWKLPEFESKYLFSVASQSKHPMSRSLVKDLKSSEIEAEITELPGEGVVATIKNFGEISMGNAALMQRTDVQGLSAGSGFIMAELEKGRGLVYWAQNKKLAAIFSFEDEIREGAEEMIRKFSKSTEVHILSGDNKKVLAALAERFNLKPDHVLGELTPLDKLEVLQSFQANGQKVAFVGDGINDAPVLNAADLAISVSSASDLAKQSSDIVLLTQEPVAIFQAFELAKKGMKTIRQNLWWAFGYNVIAIPLAFLGLINPVLCTAFMAFSDLVIIANSLRVFLSRRTL